MTKPPRWASNQTHERSESRAVRVAALFAAIEWGIWPQDTPKTQIAQALGISRWTLDRDLASVKEIGPEVERLISILSDLD